MDDYQLAWETTLVIVIHIIVSLIYANKKGARGPLYRQRLPKIALMSERG